MKNIFNNPAFTKGLGIASAAVTGIVAVSNALADQKKEAEIQEMKETLKKLQSKE